MHMSRPISCLIRLGTFLCLPLAAFAWTKSGNQYTTNGSFSDVLSASQDAALADGDVINIPAGTFSNWGASFTAVNLSKAITLKGAGQGSTTIVLDSGGPNGNYGVIQFYANATAQDFTITGSSSNDVNPFGASVAGHLDAIHIQNITYNAGTSGAYFLIFEDANGLINNCTINGGTGSTELIFGRGPTNAWQTADSPGTSAALYIESNTFGGSGYVCDINANARAVVRYNTITVAGMKIDAHGMDSNSPARSFREIEVYNNTFTNCGAEAVAIRGAPGFMFNNSVTNTDPSSAWFQLIDYGSVSPWPNYGVASISASAANPTVITATGHGYTSGFLVWVHVANSTPAIDGFYVATVTGANTFTIPVNVTVAGSSQGSNWTARERTPSDYPTYDQVGWGQDTAGVYTNRADPVYLWNNTAQGGVDWTLNWKAVDSNAITLYRTQTANPSATFTMQDMIAADRDYFKQTVGGTFTGASGVGLGTTAQMNAITPSKTGVGFWVTDQGSWNTTVTAGTSGLLYTWSG